VRTAAACGITLIGIARGTEYQIFSHAEAVGLP
jgi:formate dehydrogenase assembly factor FdhD